MSDSQPATANRAVFLSYASQDAEAVLRIAEALRASGVEVWFDKDELVGGDAWDAKIRGQIASCALFVPVMSAATQVRREGYFRREWKQAAERTRDMADETPFLLPVVIDATRDAEALVPTEFRAVQWTHLAGGEIPAKFCARVKSLLGSPEVARAFQPVSAAESTGWKARATPKVGRRVPAATWAVGAAVLGLAVVLSVVWWRPAAPAANAGAGTRPPTTEKALAPAVPAEPRRGLKSIVVLPFENLSADKEANAVFVDGMHVDVISNLLLMRELRCVPRDTAMTYRGTKKTHKEIAEELGVAFVLTGTVSRVEQKVRITGTLINPRTDEAIWNKPYDKNLTDIFAIQAELSQAIARELKAVLSPEEKKLVERRPTEDLAAYDLFIQARQLRDSNFSESKARKADALLQAAVALDPKFALAWAESSYVHGYLYLFNYDHSAERLKKATVAINTALLGAPDDPDVMLNHGYYRYFCLGDYVGANGLISEVARRQPSASAPCHAQGAIYRRQGKYQESLTAFREAAALDPGNIDTAVQVYLLETRARRWAQGQDAQAKVAELRQYPKDQRAAAVAQQTFWSSGSTREMEAWLADQGDGQAESAIARRMRLNLALARGDLATVVQSAPKFSPTGDIRDNFIGVTARLAQGHVQAARELLTDGPSVLRKRIELEPLNATLWSGLGIVHALLGDREEALRCARKAVELVPEALDSWASLPRRANLAFVLAWTGDKESALAEYARLLRLPVFGGAVSTTGTDAYLNIHSMRHHPYFFPLQGDPRFEALLNDPKNNAPLF